LAYLILSDIHANLEALEAVLADAEGRYDCVLCLGDLVDYGADPNPVVERLREQCTAIVRGNHDRAASNTESLVQFHAAARSAAIWTRRNLSDENRRFLAQLERGPLRVEEPLGQFLMVHGSPADEDEYVVEPHMAARFYGVLEQRVTWFGHTHLQGGFLLAPGGAASIPRERTLQLEPDYFYMVNPGSVGQPRDGDPRAAYALFSMEQQTVEFRRVAYDIDAAAAKIRAAGLPEVLAARLFAGV
jgi:predicted phosphodiesterase